MKTLITKELREISLWGIIGALLLIAAMSLLNLLSSNAGQTPDTLFGTFKNWMLIGAPLLAMVLGFLQIYPELARDQWAFLFHRPLTSNQIWGAKVIAGLTVYFASTLIPLFAFVAWYCVPGHFPGPFNTHLALPGILSTLTGLPFYFAGLLVTQRSFRGVWNKLLAFCGSGACLAISISDSVAWNPWLIVLVTALFNLPLAIASQGSFKSRGEITGQSILQRVMLGVVYATGWLIVVAISFGFIASVISAIHPRMISWKSPTYESFALTKQGEPVIIDSTIPDFPNSLVSISDLAGNKISGASLNGDHYIFGTHMWGRQDSSMWVGAGIVRLQAYQSWYQQIFMNNSELYYDYNSRVIDIYSQFPNSKLIGYIGVDNVIKDNPDLVAQFPSGAPNIDGGLLSFSNSVYHVLPADAAQYMPTVSRVIQTADNDPVIAASGTNLPGIDSAVCVISKRNFSVYTKHDEFVRRVALSLPTRQFNNYTVLQASDDTPIYLVNSTGIGYDSSNSRPPLSGAKLTSSNGIVVATVPDKPVAYGPARPFLSNWAGIFIPVTPAAIGSAIILGSEMSNTDSHNDTPQFKDQAYPLIWSLFGGLIAMLAFIPLGRRYGASGLKLIPWMICGLFMSWLGVLMILSMRPLPMLISCWNCGCKRSVNSDTCQHCGKTQSNPADRVGNIFEDSNSGDYNLLHSE